MSTIQPAQMALARKVKADSLTPVQCQSPAKLKIACDFRQQLMLKHPTVSDFHSEAEWLHAGLLEGDPEVVSYVPQPFRLRVKGTYYTPDVYVAGKSDTPRVIELKPRGEFDEAKGKALSAYLALKGMRFEVISNESVIEQRQLAENWLEIVRILNLAVDIDTQPVEGDVLVRVIQSGSLTLGDVVDPGNRARGYREEIALLRLLHRGHLKANLEDALLGFDTRFTVRAAT